MHRNYKIIATLAVVFLVTFGGGILIGKIAGIGTFNESIEKKATKGKTVNILVMGIDARSATENSRSDTMILISIDRKTNKIAMLWIPRDTRVEVGINRYDKANSVNYIKGPEEACNVVGKLLGTKVNYYAIANFYGFEEIINLLGGVTIDVESNMNHPDPNPKLNINLAKGVQELNGKQALDYVRYRGGPTADIGRTGRQQKFIKAVTKEFLKPKNIVKLPKLVPQVFEHVNTNIPLDDMLYMVSLAKEFSSDSVITQTLPGYSFTDPKNGASYWQADKEITKTILADLLEGKTYDVAQDPPNWVQPAPTIYAEPDEEEELDSAEGNEDEIDRDINPGAEGYLPGDNTNASDEEDTQETPKDNVTMPENQDLDSTPSEEELE